MALAEHGAAAVILEKDCSAETVMAKIKELLENRDAYDQMRKALMQIAVPDCAERICAIMEELIAGKTRK